MIPSFRIHRSLTAGLSAYIAGIAVLSIYRSGLTVPFCGSLTDFTSEPVPGVCLGFLEYMANAVTHPEFAAPGIITGITVAAAYIYVTRDEG